MLSASRPPQLTLRTMYRMTYLFKSSFPKKSFKDYEVGDVHPITYGAERKVPKKNTYRRVLKTVEIPLQYARIVHQFIIESKHGELDTGHESLRRFTYVQATLDAFGRELDRYRGEPAAFRSKILNPILQRQIRGVPDAYAPSIRNAVAPGVEKLTIKDVTSFYLGVDVLDPKYCPSLRRNLIYSREALWHLAHYRGSLNYRSVDDFETSIKMHDLVMENLQQAERYQGKGVPPFHAVEVDVIVAYGLEDFFDVELERTVSNIHIFTTTPPLTFLQ